jgi:Ca2+/Na+ antiporter
MIIAFLITLLPVALTELVEGNVVPSVLVLIPLVVIFLAIADRAAMEAEYMKSTGWWSVRIVAQHTAFCRRLLFLSFIGTYYLAYILYQGRSEIIDRMLFLLDILALIILILMVAKEARHHRHRKEDIAIFSQMDHVTMALAVSDALRTRGYRLTVRPERATHLWWRCSFNVERIAGIDVYRYRGYWARSAIRIAPLGGCSRKLALRIARDVDREISLVLEHGSPMHSGDARH